MRGLIATLGALALVLTACGGGADQGLVVTPVPGSATTGPTETDGTAPPASLSSSVDDPADFVVAIENGAFRPSQVTLGSGDSGVVEFRNQDSVTYEIVAGNDEFEPLTVEPDGTAQVDFGVIEPGLVRYAIIVGNARIPGSVDSRDLGAAPSTSPSDGGTLAAVPETENTVLVGDRTVSLDSYGCGALTVSEQLILVGFGSDADGTGYAVRVEEYSAHVTEIGADASFAATSRFAPTWSSGHVEGAGEFLTQDGERIPGGFQADCTEAAQGSTRIGFETGEVHDLLGPVCVTSDAGFTFSAGVIDGARVAGEGLAPFMRRLDAPESLIEDATESGMILEHLWVLTSGVQPGPVGGVATALLGPASEDGLFTTALPAPAFSITADLDYQDTLKRNPRVSPELVDAAIAALGAESTVAIDIECAVNLEGPGLATVHDLP